MRIRTVLVAFLATAALLTGVSLSGLANADDNSDEPKVITMTFEDRGLGVSLKEIQQKIEGTLGQSVGPPSKAFVITDNGAYLTDDQFKALLAGTPVSEFEVLSIVERPGGNVTLADLDRGSGSVQQKGKKFTFDWGPFHVEATLDYELWPPKVTADVHVEIKL